jgi:hypothetical protein
VKGRKNGERTQIVLERTNWRPTADFLVHIIDDQHLWPLERLGYSSDECGPLYLLAGQDEFPDSTRDDVENHFVHWSSDQLRHCIEWSEALHGRPFEDPSVAQRYYRKLPAWPESGYEHYYGDRGMVVGMQPDSAYDPARMSKTERIFIEGMRAALSAREKEAPSEGDATKRPEAPATNARGETPTP